MSFQDFFSQHRIPKKQVAKILGVSERMLFNYINKPCTDIDDFCNDYPSFGDGKLTRNGLTDYQVWVLTKVRDIYRMKVGIQSLYTNEKLGLYTIKVLKPDVLAYLSKESYEHEVNSLKLVA